MSPTPPPSVPSPQQALRDRCVHPTETWRPFPDPPDAGTVVARFEAIVREHATRVAVSEGGRRLTYGDLDALANRMAHGLLRTTGPGVEPIAILFEHGVPMLATLLGVLKAGKLYVPLSPQDPPARLAHIVGDSTARLIVADPANLPLARSLAEGRQAVAADALMDGNEADAPGVRIPFEAYAYLIYTSGSTGLPKGRDRDARRRAALHPRVEQHLPRLPGRPRDSPRHARLQRRGEPDLQLRAGNEHPTCTQNRGVGPLAEVEIDVSSHQCQAGTAETSTFTAVAAATVP